MQVAAHGDGPLKGVRVFQIAEAYETWLLFGVGLTAWGIACLQDNTSLALADSGILRQQSPSHRTIRL